MGAGPPPVALPMIARSTCDTRPVIACERKGCTSASERVHGHGASHHDRRFIQVAFQDTTCSAEQVPTIFDPRGPRPCDTPAAER